MNNEEKMLAILESLAQGQASMQADISALKEGQSSIETRLTSVESIAQATHNNLAVQENENRLAYDGIHDKLDVIENQVDVLVEHQPIIVNLLENYDLRLKRLEKRVLAG